MCTDREGSLFGLRPEVAERRRIVFWMIFKTDVWEVRKFVPYLCYTFTISQSLCIGRPGVFTFGTHFMDSEFPVGTGPDAECTCECCRQAVADQFIISGPPCIEFCDGHTDDCKSHFITQTAELYRNSQARSHTSQVRTPRTLSRSSCCHAFINDAHVHPLGTICRY
jgi:hypothetical protein